MNYLTPLLSPHTHIPSPPLYTSLVVTFSFINKEIKINPFFSLFLFLYYNIVCLFEQDTILDNKFNTIKYECLFYKDK
jgi:hypothetical protein